jgi:hypothetical protein
VTRWGRARKVAARASAAQAIAIGAFAATIGIVAFADERARGRITRHVASLAGEAGASATAAAAGSVVVAPDERERQESAGERHLEGSPELQGP